MDEELFGVLLERGSIPGEEEIEAMEDIFDEDGDAEADRYASQCLNAYWPY